MPLDLYFKISTDPNFQYDELETEDELDQFLNQIDMILTTRKGDVISHPGMGANLEDYIWNLRITADQIRSAVTSQINTYSSLAAKIPYDIEVNFIKGTSTADMILVDVIINNTKVLGIGARP